MHLRNISVLFRKGSPIDLKKPEENHRTYLLYL